MMKRLLTLTLLAGSFMLTAIAAEPTVANRQTASNYYAYPYPELPLPELTATPKGYEPFHMEHYGRHGSRWHIGTWVYHSPIDLLRPAERNGKLNERGKELMAQLREIEIKSRGRDGELTPLGARQHLGIARRMTQNFPEIFSGKSRVDARSTDVVRCILSMDNEMQELKAFNPNIEITTDGSKRDVRYLNYNDTAAENRYKEARKRLKAEENALLEANKIDYAAFAGQLIDDPQFIADSIDSRGLFDAVFRITANAQSHDDQEGRYDLFTDKDLHSKWVLDNANWFLRYGNTKMTDGVGPMRQRYLMRNWIESADTAVMRKEPGANMRFGHEVVVLPMAVLMELDDYGREINDPTAIESQWHNYDLLPMASNIQMIFYRPTGKKDYTADDVLVKVLFNEREMCLPVKAVSGPYYRWTDLRSHYLDRIGENGGIFPPEQPY